MSAEIVNLRQFRKSRARAEKGKQADQNRVSFGRTKTEKQLSEALNDKALKNHEAGRLDKDGDN